MLRLLRAHGLRPDTDLGQHFLVDENLVDVALRESRLAPDDVALEVGAGLGVLTAALARSVRHVHAVELDRRLAPVLGEVLAGVSNVAVHWDDALRLALEELAPRPTALVANLPYSIATPLVMESLHRLPEVTRWCVMVQREVAERWLSPPGRRQYGGASVLLQLTARVTFRRSVGRDVFAPPPRVDSALVAFERVAPGPSPALRALVRAAFAVRRKTLVNALGGAGADRAAVAAALAHLGHGASARAGDLPPGHYPPLAEALAWTA